MTGLSLIVDDVTSASQSPNEMLYSHLRFSFPLKIAVKLLYRNFQMNDYENKNSGVPVTCHAVFFKEKV